MATAHLEGRPRFRQVGSNGLPVGVIRHYGVAGPRRLEGIDQLRLGREELREIDPDEGLLYAIDCRTQPGNRRAHRDRVRTHRAAGR